MSSFAICLASLRRPSFNLTPTPLLKKGEGLKQCCALISSLAKDGQRGVCCPNLTPTPLLEKGEGLKQCGVSDLPPYQGGIKGGLAEDKARSQSPTSWLPLLIVFILCALPVNAAPTGKTPTGKTPTGTAPTGTAPTGTAPTGTATTGTAPTGAATTGAATTGTSAAGTTTTAAATTGTATRGAAMTGAAPTGTATTIATSTGTVPTGPAPTSPAPTSAGWADSDEWRMVGSNEGHTSAVTCNINLPLHRLWRVTAADLGAPLGEPAYLHPRTLAYGVILVEMDAANGVSLVALDAKTGEVKWQDSFPTPQIVSDAGLYPAVDDEDVALYLNQAPPGKSGGDQWNLSCLDLSNGKLEWESGPLKLAQARKAPATYDTLFRPVVSSDSQLLIAPDFFGRPPLVAFSWKDGSVQWRSDSSGCDIPITAHGPADDPVALAADYAAGRPVVHSTRLKDGARAGALALPPPGSGEEWTGGVWDSQVHWADPGTGAVCVSVGRLRPEKTWPAASCVVSVPGTSQQAAWTADGPDSLDGPILGGALFLGHWNVSPTGPDPTLRCLDVLTGRVAWSIHGDAAGKPLVAAPGMVLGRSITGLLTAWSSVDGHVLWSAPASFLRDVIAGEGEVIASYGGSHPSAETAVLIGYR